MAIMQDKVELESRAQAIVYRMAEDCTGGKQFCHLSHSIYNTAWVSMVHKSVDQQETWLFPGCFQYILDQQLPHGGWQGHEPEIQGVASELDGIVNTMAALLALCTHRASEGIVGRGPATDLDERILKASSALDQMLQEWDIHASDLVAMELIIPAHLRMLERHGLKISFPGRRQLDEKYRAKLRKFKPEQLYTKTATTLLYCLEAMIGEIEFDRVALHKVQGAMMASPASTAAYIMNTRTWDLEAEDYLRRACSDGGVPELWPTTIFETLWVLKTFLAGGITPEKLGFIHLGRLADFVEDTFSRQAGILGFAPDVLCDADDTSCGIYILNKLGRPTGAQSFVRTFETEHHFRSFQVDGNPSPTVNSHVLNALLHAPEASTYQMQITKSATFICDCWWQSDVKDKWNMSEMYTIMVMSQALVSMLQKRFQGQIPQLPPDLLEAKLPLTLFGMLVQVLKVQTSEGSWGPKHARRESTACAVIALKTLASFALADETHTQLETSIRRGQQFLSKEIQHWTEPDYLWAGKSLFGCGVFTETYVVTAMYMDAPSHQLDSNFKSMFEIQGQVNDATFRRFAKLPFFADTPSWLFDACIVEAHLYQPLIKRIGSENFPQQDIKATKHLEIIPFLFTSSSHAEGAGLCPSILCQMIVTSLCLYEIDHYMEAILSRLDLNGLDEVKTVIRNLIPDSRPNRKTAELDNTAEHMKKTQQSDGGADHGEIEQVLSSFTQWILNDTSTTRSTEYDRELLRKELRTFLLAHVTSIEESSRLVTMSIQGGDTRSKSSTFFDWVHGTSAYHVGGTLAFPRMICLLPGQRKSSREIFNTPEAKYLAQDLSKHLAILARMENDYGGFARDLHEHNLSSVHFLGLPASHDHPAEELDIPKARQSLRQLAAFERECYERDMRMLKPLINVQTLKALRTFCNATDLGGQMYAVDDFSPKINKA